MRQPALLLIGIACVGPASVVAQPNPDAAKQELVRQIQPHIPANWSFRAAWRDSTLVGYVSPPTQEAFDLLYDVNRQKQVLDDLCASLTPAVWELIAADESIALEPVIGGKTGNVRIECERQ